MIQKFGQIQPSNRGVVNLVITFARSVYVQFANRQEDADDKNSADVKSGSLNRASGGR